MCQLWHKETNEHAAVRKTHSGHDSQALPIMQQAKAVEQPIVNQFRPRENTLPKH
jgi:hypothetical protein